MMSLILLTCTLAGSDCRPIMAADGLQMMECVTRAQQIAAQYQADNPGRKAVRMICTDHRRVDFYLGRGQA